MNQGRFAQQLANYGILARIFFFTWNKFSWVIWRSAGQPVGGRCPLGKADFLWET
jgi:hypothetical protein